MKRDIYGMFGLDKRPPKIGTVDRLTQNWTPDDQRGFLAAIPRVAKLHDALALPDGSCVRIGDVVDISLLDMDDGRWIAGITTKGGDAFLAAFRSPADAAATVKAWIDCWATVVQRNSKKGNLE